MQIRRLDPQTLRLSDFNAFCCELLNQIVPSAQHDDPAVRSRLFSSPTAGREPELEMDWREYVQPELQQIFQSAVDIVAGDLSDFPGADTAPEDLLLEIPVSHLDAWIHTLTQARLALAARFAFSEAEMEHSVTPEVGLRALALFQMDFYGFLLDCFVREGE